MDPAHRHPTTTCEGRAWHRRRRIARQNHQKPPLPAELTGRIRAVWAVRLLLAKPLIERGGMDSSMIDGKDLNLCQPYPTPSIVG
jgi:hypothetical protein